jgi:hypothetical protein
MADVLTFDVNQVTPRMLVDFKEKTGVNLLSLFDGKEPADLMTGDPEVIAGLIWIAKRMGGDPDATWEDALDTPFSTLDLAGSEAPDPTTAG